MVIELGGEVKISISDVVKVARQYEKVTISSKARDLINSSHDVLSRLVSSNVKIYGVNTGLGELYNISVNPSEVTEKSVKYVKYHREIRNFEPMNLCGYWLMSGHPSFLMALAYLHLSLMLLDSSS